MTTGPRDPDAPRVHAETREPWRQWLAEHHATATGVWLVFWKPATGRPRLSYEEAIEEGIAFGWVDSLARTFDDERSGLWFTPRKPSSPWSRTNKERLARVEAAGRMAPPGWAAVEAAKASGAWTYLDDVEALVVPDDLAAALAALPGARERWDAFTESARRQVLRWLLDARRPATRAARVEETARLAAQGVPAHQQER
ncbi:YdeI/OmpD-associated family protein [Cellulomonas composti]|uniref:Bacteriocin-protection protein, YdeI/OmpD-associated family n=1 Tax=Cellulomonas composti TaxID=266130 RepID=A0A511JCB3_9CELL|nr:YdeI/OmpD-associated family protein [Cellulomonas composti]GEL95409.1 hypothetical protein CCO02nite_20670 [Cellulomonas composti]